MRPGHFSFHLNLENIREERGGEGDVFVCMCKCVGRKLSVKALGAQCEGGVECDGSEDTLGMDNDRRWVKELTGRTPVVARRLTAKVLGVRRN